MLSERVLCIKANKINGQIVAHLGGVLDGTRSCLALLVAKLPKKNCTSCPSEERQFNDRMGFFFALVVYSRIAAFDKTPNSFEISRCLGTVLS